MKVRLAVRKNRQRMLLKLHGPRLRRELDDDVLRAARAGIPCLRGARPFPCSNSMSSNLARPPAMRILPRAFSASRAGYGCPRAVHLPVATACSIWNIRHGQLQLGIHRTLGGERRARDTCGRFQGQAVNDHVDLRQSCWTAHAARSTATVPDSNSNGSVATWTCSSPAFARIGIVTRGTICFPTGIFCPVRSPSITMASG